jgi:CubicO group peptidase (beta-lactamase class C family)
MNGMQLAVVKNGEKRTSINLGFADIKNSRPVTSDTRFRINSVSKSMTAAGLIKLAESSKLDLDAPIQKYLGDFPNIIEPFTTRQLAGHLSRVRDYNENNLSDFVRLKHYTSSTEALEIVKNDTLLFKPGTSFHYSTFAWIIIGAVMEMVSQETYGNFMEERIFKPLNLKNTCLDNVQMDIPNRSKFYDVAGNENEFGDWSYKYPGGGLLSTAEDLVSFGNELLNGKYFDQKWKAALFQSQRTIDNKETGYGLGWYIGVDKRGNRVWHHAGDSFSSSSHLIIYPDQNIIISFLGNSQDGAAFDWQRIADLVLAND